MTVGRFVTATNEVTIGGFWREYAKGELKTRKKPRDLEILKPLLGEEVHGQSVLRERCHLRCVCVGVTKYAH